MNSKMEDKQRENEKLELHTCQITKVRESRLLTRNNLHDMVNCNENLNQQEKECLCDVLETHLDNMSTKSGKFNLFKYRFQVNTDKAIVGY
jgi:hypothetical protein